MMKTKLFVPLFVILVMGMATSAFAQLNCAISTGTTSRATATGHTEPAGDISFNCTPPVGATATGQATITVSYPVTITNDTTWPATATFTSPLGNVRVTDFTGSFVGAPPTIAFVNTTTNQVVISVPPNPATAGSFTLRGVLVSLAGTAGAGPLNATISVSPPQTAGTNVLINSGDNTPTIITSIMPGLSTTTPPALAAAGAGSATSALFLGSGTNVIPTRAGFAITATEGYIDAFRTAFNSQANSATNGTDLTFTFSGMASGSIIQNCTPTISPNLTGITLAVTGSGIANTSGVASLVVSFTGTTAPTSPNQTVIETVTLTCGTNVAAPAAGTPAFGVGTSTVTPLVTPIAATVKLSPIGTAQCPTQTNLVCRTGSTGVIPRFQDTPIAVGTVISFTPATTTFLLPYVVSVPGANGYDTGIAIANTTADPASFLTVAQGGATDQEGTITFTFFPAAGAGLTAAPNSSTFTTPLVQKGGSYIDVVSVMLANATPAITGTFQGYAIAVANFTNGHGAAFAYGGSAAGRVSSTTEVLVLASPSIQSRNSSPAGFPLVEYTTK
jgi:hypothetical protein